MLQRCPRPLSCRRPYGEHWRRQLRGLGHVPLDLQPFIFFCTLQYRKISYTGPYMVFKHRNDIPACSFVTVHCFCMNFTIFLLVARELLFLSFLPLLARNSGDTTDGNDGMGEKREARREVKV